MWAVLVKDRRTYDRSRPSRRESTRRGSLAIGIGISALIGVSLAVAPPALAVSHRTSAEIDIHGQVTGTNGQPITGASITLVAWPPHRVLGNLRPRQQGAGAGVVLNKNAAYTYEAGVDITDIIGIDLSAQTGYDTQTSISFHVTRGTHWLCGDNTYPADYPQRTQWGLPRR